jgi:hypothetical protein
MPARGQDFIYPKDFRANKVADCMCDLVALVPLLS